MIKKIGVLFFIVMVVSTSFQVYAAKASKTTLHKSIAAAMVGDHRSSEHIARNKYRNPEETLLFLGLTDNMHVVEIWPGKGWYSEILAPIFKDKGLYYAAGFSKTAQRTPQWRKNVAKQFDDKIAERPKIYGKTIVTGLSVPEDTTIAPKESADAVLTFRNVHNWMKGDYADGVFTAMYAALKPGGILGVIEHRAKEGTSLEEMKKSGYVTESEVIRLAKKAGFTLHSRSEINANPKDTKNHPAGVWTLPPSLRLKEQDKEKYLAIGESDRMTLKFIK